MTPAPLPSAEATAALARRFPPGFRWGVATSAFQIEGAPTEGGKGESIWDRFCRVPGAIADGSNGDVACDHVHRLEEDLDLIASLGVDSYRFSVSWPRVQPLGHGAWSEAGLDFYERLVDGLRARGIAPYLTLNHWDLPQALQDEGGWAARQTVHRFVDYALGMQLRLGDRLAAITTHNEPWVVAVLGHEQGVFAPGLKSRRTAVQAREIVRARQLDRGVEAAPAPAARVHVPEPDTAAAQLGEPCRVRHGHQVHVPDRREQGPELVARMTVVLLRAQRSLARKTAEDEQTRVARDHGRQALQALQTRWLGAGRCRAAAHKATSRLMRAVEVPRRRVVHGGGRSALATNRPSAAVGNPCSTRGASCAALLTPRGVAADGVHRLPCPCGNCLRRLPSQGPCETRSPQGAGRPRRAPRCSARPSKLERRFMSFPPRLPTRTVIPQLQGVCP